MAVKPTSVKSAPLLFPVPVRLWWIGLKFATSICSARVPGARQVRHTPLSTDHGWCKKPVTGLPQHAEQGLELWMLAPQVSCPVPFLHASVGLCGYPVAAHLPKTQA